MGGAVRADRRGGAGFPGTAVSSFHKSNLAYTDLPPKINTRKCPFWAIGQIGQLVYTGQCGSICAYPQSVNIEAVRALCHWMYEQGV